jgi:hypothetical protein
MVGRKRKRGGNWRRYLAAHDETVLATGLPPLVFHSEGRFRRLLGEGTVSTEGTLRASLDSLDDQQWVALERFCRAFFQEFESYEPLEQFLAFKHELQRRGSAFRG